MHGGGGKSEREMHESDLEVMGVPVRVKWGKWRMKKKPTPVFSLSQNEGLLFHSTQRYHKIILLQFILYVCHKVSGLPV